MTQLLTNSRMSCFRSCPRRHQIRYELAIAPEEESIALRVGTAYHAALEAIDIGGDPWSAITARGDLDAYSAAMVAAMVTVHQEQRAGQTLEVVASEVAFDLPLRNPTTGAASKVWRIAGKIDRIYRLPDGRLCLQDYKTTTEDMTPGSDFWLRLSLDQQMSLYVLAARELGHDIQTIVYDVTERPMQKPHKATPVEDRKFTQKASKLADGTIRPAGSLYAGQRETDETPEEFAGRVAETMRAEPTRFFARHEIARTDGDLDDVRHEVWSQQLAMREMQRSGRWFKNPNACVSPYRCPYLSICAQSTQRLTDSVPDGFRKLADAHPELARSEQAEQQPAVTPPGA